VIAAGPDPINDRVDFARLDMTLLTVETTNAEDKALPKAYTLLRDTGALRLKEYLFAMGYPARPSTAAMIDPNTGQFSPEIADRLGQIFNVSYGRKYVSPGAIESTADGDRRWVFSHDATTLGGSSGSCVVSIADPLGVVGLHFGGSTLTANYAHSLAAVRANGGIAAALAALQNWT
jgi:serine protease